MTNLNSKLNTLKKPEASGLAFSVAVVLFILASFVFSVVTSGFTAEQRASEGYFYASFLVSEPIILIALIALFKLTPYGLSDYFGKQSFKAINILPVVLIFVGMFFGLNKVNDYFVEFLENFGYKEPSTTLPSFSVLNYILCIVIVCALPAVFEEALFRGVILGGIKEKGYIAALVAAAAFALYHMSPAKTVYQLIAGFLFSLVALKTGNILFTIAIHFLNNFLVVTFNYFAPDLFAGNSLSVWFVVLGLVSLAVGVVLLIVFNKDEKKEKTADNRVIGRFLLYGAVGFISCLVIWASSIITGVIS